jgi:glyoxylase-like metal-dependent hydrolase (beta-lactamase superfamily II)
MTLVAPGVYSLGDGLMNFYVLVEGTDVTLVDAGFPGQYDLLAALLESIGRSVHDIGAVLVTHAHLDHIGLAERLRREVGATVWVHTREVPALANPLRRLPDTKPEQGMGGFFLRNPMALRFPIHWARLGAFRTPAVTEASTFDDAAVLDVPGRPRVVAIPGHTPGSVAFHLPADGVVFTGDALVTHDGLTGCTGVGPQIVGPMFSHDTAEARASLDALNAVDAGLVLPGHGDPFWGPVADAVAQAQHA